MNSSVTYQDSGVDIDAGNSLVERIKPLVKSTERPGVLGSVGGFGGLFELPLSEYRQPVLVSGADGVGTKLKLAITENRYDSIGIDLVAMCVNDIVVSGAEPLFFLDYYATSQLDVDVATAVVSGIAAGCKLAGCALSGGETAEMPGLYQSGDFDLAGFAVGIVEKDQIIDGSDIKAGDNIIGLTSSGLHSNGFSMVNYLLNKCSDSHPLAAQSGSSLRSEFLTPTTIYVKSVLQACKAARVKGIAHITGGGLLENVPRILPAGVQAVIDTGSWQRDDVFQWLKQQGRVETEEMYRVFNCGIGMVVIAAEEDTDILLSSFKASNQQALVIGRIASRIASQSDTAQPAVILQHQDAF